MFIARHIKMNFKRWTLKRFEKKKKVNYLSKNEYYQVIETGTANFKQVNYFKIIYQQNLFGQHA